MNKIKRFYNFIVHGDSTLSWIINVIIAFIIVKFLIYPLLGVVLSTSYPLVAVVSSSMDHDIIFNENTKNFEICGKIFPEKDKLNFDEYWDICGDYYETNLQITKEQFKEFPHKNGFKKGDIMILIGSKDLKLGDVIVYPNPNFKYPIIHRVVETNNNRFITKGDHNGIKDNQEITEYLGKTILRVPKLGYVKIIFTDYIVKPIFGR